ncbi:MAG: phosphoribosylglycinamide formyltransferase [Gammaproteobacteria bacterium]|nr:phosphoribosylglycinamide formyltransferase [Gammaproteobacteria bacterium]
MGSRVPLPLAVLISGRGSNMAAIARACASGEIPARIAVVVADSTAAAGIELARSLGLRTAVVPAAAHAGRAPFEDALEAALAPHGAELIVLAGFMRILSAAFVARHRGRALNIHPSLLPKHKGLHTHRRVLEAGETLHGASVHYVTEELDGGPVVLQGRVRVQPGDDEAALSARVQRCEHIIYPRVIGWIAAGRLVWREERPWLDGVPLPAPIVEDFSAAS